MADSDSSSEEDSIHSLANVPVLSYAESGGLKSIYTFLGSFLLSDDCACRLGFLSCDAFQVTPSQTELVYSPEMDKPPQTDGKVDPIIMLLTGVVKFNSTLTCLNVRGNELDDD